MIKKSDLIERLSVCIQTEESAIPLYSKHITSALFFSGFPEEQQIKLKEILEELVSDSERHKKILNALLERVRSSNQDVY